MIFLFKGVIFGFHVGFPRSNAVDGKNPAPPDMYETL